MRISDAKETTAAHPVEAVFRELVGTPATPKAEEAPGEVAEGGDEGQPLGRSRREKAKAPAKARKARD